MLKPTTDLKEALNRFDPLRPLQTADELRDFYVARAHSPLEPLVSYLKVRQQPAKLLFMGHRGSGKSTELAKLASRLEHQFMVAHFHAGQMLNLSSDVKPMDVVLGCGFALLNAAFEHDVTLDHELWNKLEQWLRNNVLTEKVKVKQHAGGVGVSLKLFITELSAKWHAESATRTEIRPRLRTILSELADRINQAIEHIRTYSGRPPLILVEDLDKTLLPQAEEMFFQEGDLLRLLNCHIVYTFPIALRYSNDYAQIRLKFETDFKLPNVIVTNRDGSPDEVGRAILRDLVLRRADASLFAPEALDRAVEWSGGLVVDLVRLLQGAILRAIVDNAPQVTPAMVAAVAAEIRSDFRAALRAEHYQALRDAADRHQVVNETAVQETLHNLSLLEYRNAEDWCDVHPIVKPLLNPPTS